MVLHIQPCPITAKNDNYYLKANAILILTTHHKK